MRCLWRKSFKIWAGTEEKLETEALLIHIIMQMETEE